MNVLKKEYFMVVFVLIIIVHTSSIAAVSGNTADEQYYFYDKATDLRIEQIIQQAQGLLKNGETDKAIALLVKEQDRLDKQKRKVNVSGEFVKTSDGTLRKLKSGEASSLELLAEEKVPRPPSPLILMLTVIQMDQKQSSDKVIQYYQEYAKSFTDDRNSIIAAAQTLSVLGLTNNESWEFVNETFDDIEKSLLSEYLLDKYLEYYSEEKTREIVYRELSALHSDSFVMDIELFNRIQEAVVAQGGSIKYISFNNKALARINLPRIRERIQKDGSLSSREQEIIQVILDSLKQNRQGINELNSNQIERFQVTFETYGNIVNNLAAINIATDFLTPRPPSVKINIKDVEEQSKMPDKFPNIDDIKRALRELSPPEVPENIKEYYVKLNQDNSNYVETLFWECCSQWGDYNLQNRLNKAEKFRRQNQFSSACELYNIIMNRYKDRTGVVDAAISDYIETRFDEALWCRNNRLYDQACDVYNALLEKYPEQAGLFDRIQYASLECHVEEIFMTGKDYSLFADILNDYGALFENETKYYQKANVIKAISGIFQVDAENVQELMQTKGLSSQSFLVNRVFNLLSYDQRMLFDNYIWENCQEWNEYNLERQYSYALLYLESEQYLESLKYLDRLYERYKKNLPEDIVYSYIKTAMRAEETGVVLSLLDEFEDFQETEHMIASDILWLLQKGKPDSVSNILNGYESLHGNNQFLSTELKYYLTYSLLLMGEYEDAQRSFSEMKSVSAESLYTMKMSYLIQQKERLLSAYKLTQNDPIEGMLTKAGTSFDEGELEIALGIYLRVFAEYADRREESSRACYLLGYYYLLSGDFEAANEILVFLQEEYAATAYAREADVLIQRIKDFTAS